MGKKYIKKYYYKKSKWSPNIQNINETNLTAETGEFFITQELAKNPVQNSSTISQPYTIKNVELNFEINSDYISTLGSICLYIMYAPQGMTVGSNYAREHPEYIMAFRFLGKPLSKSSAPGRNTVRVKSRLSRRLQTGDSLILFITGYSTDLQSRNIVLSGVFRWWSKAN